SVSSVADSGSGSAGPGRARSGTASVGAAGSTARCGSFTAAGTAGSPNNLVPTITARVGPKAIAPAIAIHAPPGRPRRRAGTSVTGAAYEAEGGSGCVGASAGLDDGEGTDARCDAKGSKASSSAKAAFGSAVSGSAASDS